MIKNKLRIKIRKRAIMDINGEKKVILKVMISTRENDLDQEIEIEKINALTLQNSISLK